MDFDCNSNLHLQEARNAYYMKNYPDFFATVGKTMVKKSDGSFMLVDDAELQKLVEMAAFGASLGLEVHAGHGSTPAAGRGDGPRPFQGRVRTRLSRCTTSS